MKKRLVLLAAIIIGLSVVAFESITYLQVKEAECAWCFTGTCYSSSICGSGCFCFKRGSELSGYCGSFESN